VPPPCSEIILRPYQFCNLTEVVVRDSDDVASLARKARLAAILGTFQASLVDFPYLRDIWRHNTAEVRLCVCVQEIGCHFPRTAQVVTGLCL
jgi:ribonucleoside-diphosphate reductase alpha chain